MLGALQAGSIPRALPMSLWRGRPSDFAEGRAARESGSLTTTTSAFLDGHGMGWLVEADLASAGQAKRGLASPIRLFDGRANHLLSPQRLDGCRQVIAHQVENRPQEIPPSVCLSAGPVRGMEGNLGGRQSKNQPALAGIHVTKTENVAKEGPVCPGVRAVKQDVSTKNHGEKSTPLTRTASGQIPSPAPGSPAVLPTARLLLRPEFP